MKWLRNGPYSILVFTYSWNSNATNGCHLIYIKWWKALRMTNIILYICQHFLFPNFNKTWLPNWGTLQDLERLPPLEIRPACKWVLYPQNQASYVNFLCVKVKWNINFKKFWNPEIFLKFWDFWLWALNIPSNKCYIAT